MYERIINDFGERVIPTTAGCLIKDYLFALEQGETEEESVKFSMVKSEARIWHSRGSLSFERSRWRDNKRLVVTPERFTGLINSVFMGDFTFQDLSKEILRMNSKNERAIENKIKKFIIRNSLKSHPYKRKIINSVLKNSTNVLRPGLVRFSLRDAFAWKAINEGEFRKSWLKIKGGKDLYKICKFDIKKAVEKIYGNDNKKLRKTPVTPEDIIAVGVGISSEWMVGKLLGSPDKLSYVRRWINWWRTGNNFGKIDELITTYFADRGFMTGKEHLRPPTVLRLIRERQQEEEERNNVPSPPKEQEYKWVKDVFQEKKTRYGTLKAITSLDELEEVGEKLDNCASTYWINIQEEEMILIYLQDKEDIKALGGYKENGTLTQLLGHDNDPVSDGVRKVFDNLLISFHNWP